EGKVTCVVVNASGFLAYLTGARDELVQVGVAGVEPVVDPAGSEGEADPAVELVQGADLVGEVKVGDLGVPGVLGARDHDMRRLAAQDLPAHPCRLFRVRVACRRVVSRSQPTSRATSGWKRISHSGSGCSGAISA